MKPFEYPEPLDFINGNALECYYLICSKLDSYLLEKIDTVLLSFAAMDLYLIKITAPNIIEENIFQKTNEGTISNNASFEILQIKYRSFIDIAEKFYLSAKDCDNIIFNDLKVKLPQNVMILLKTNPIKN